MRILFARVLVGSSAEIAEALHAPAAFREMREIVFAPPFAQEDYVQLLTDMATGRGPALRWQSKPGA